MHEIKMIYFSCFRSEENEIVPQVLQAVLNLPDTTHVALRYTSTQLVGELSEWIEVHPQYLGKPRYQYLCKIQPVNAVIRIGPLFGSNFNDRFDIPFLRIRKISIVESICKLLYYTLN